MHALNVGDLISKMITNCNDRYQLEKDQLASLKYLFFHKLHNLDSDYNSVFSFCFRIAYETLPQNREYKSAVVRMLHPVVRAVKK